MQFKSLKLPLVFLAGAITGTIAGAISYAFLFSSLVNIYSHKTRFSPQPLRSSSWTCTELLNSSLNEIDISSDNNHPIVEATKPLPKDLQHITLSQKENSIHIDYLTDFFEAEVKKETDDVVSFDFSREIPWEQTSFTAILNKKTGFLVLSAISKIGGKDTGRVGGFQKSFSCR